MNYFQFINTEDKILHLLQAAYQAGIFNEAVEECTEEFGYKVTNRVVAEFKKTKEKWLQYQISLIDEVAIDLEKYKLC